MIRNYFMSLAMFCGTLGLICIGFNGVASADLVSPTSVSLGPVGAGQNGAGTNLDTGTHGIEHTHDLTGIQGGAPLTTASIHDPYASSNAGRALNSQSNGSGAHTASFLFDLGGAFDLDGLALWNGNEDDNRAGKTLDERDKTGRGIASANFLTSTDGVNFTAWGNSNFTRESFDFGGLPGSTVDQSYVAVTDVLAQAKTFSLASGVTHIQMDATNHGGGNIVNFNEIAFNTVAVPEPGTFGLALFGLTYMAVRRRRL